MKRNLIHITLGGLLFLNSCMATLAPLEVEVLRPGDVAIPVNIARIAVVNHAWEQPNDIGHEIKVGSTKAINDTLSVDSLAYSALYSMAEFMEQQAFFDSLLVLHGNYRDTTNIMGGKPMDLATARQICDSVGVDALLALDALVHKDVVTTGSVKDSELAFAILDVEVKSLWRLYDPWGDSIVAKVITCDTLQWEAFDYSMQEAAFQLTERVPALHDGAILAGEKAARKWIPYWEKISRQYFTTGGDPNMIEARNLAWEGRWEEAQVLWRRVYETTEKNAKRRARCAYNTAITYEMKGDLKEAVVWAFKAHSLYEKDDTLKDMEEAKMVVHYVQELSVRLREQKELGKQFLGEEEEEGK